MVFIHFLVCVERSLCRNASGCKYRRKGRKIEKLSSHALLRLHHSDRMRAECRDCALKASHIFHVVSDNLVAERRIVDVILIDIRRKVLIRGINSEVLSAHEFAASDDKHSDG